jgi:hypothetical protein
MGKGERSARATRSTNEVDDERFWLVKTAQVKVRIGGEL